MSRLLEWVQELGLRRFDGVVAVSRPLANSLVARGVSRERIHEIQNAWTPPAGAVVSREEGRASLGAREGDALLGWVGRLIPVKGCDIFLAALAMLQSERWTAVVIGDGPERSRLESLAVQLKIGHRVRFQGAIPEAARYFSALDLLVLSSRSEGTPMVLLEAMGARVAIAATAVGGVPDVLRTPHEGWVIPPESAEALSEAIREAVRDPSTRTARAEMAFRRLSSCFDSHSWIRRHEEVYQAALRNRRAV